MLVLPVSFCGQDHNDDALPIRGYVGSIPEPMRWRHISSECARAGMPQLGARSYRLATCADQDLDEVELSEEYGISRTPMRDVLRRWREKDTLERGRFALLGSPTSSWTQSNAPMGYRMAGGIRWDDFEEALAAVRDVGPGGHYLGHPHTPANFQRAFFMPKLFDNNSFEQWSADGSKDTPSALSTKPARSVRRMRSRSSTNASTKRRARFPPSMR